MADAASEKKFKKLLPKANYAIYMTDIDAFTKSHIMEVFFCDLLRIRQMLGQENVLRSEEKQK